MLIGFKKKEELPAPLSFLARHTHQQTLDRPPFFILHCSRPHPTTGDPPAIKDCTTGVAVLPLVRCYRRICTPAPHHPSSDHPLPGLSLPRPELHIADISYNPPAISRLVISPGCASPPLSRRQSSPPELGLSTAVQPLSGHPHLPVFR